VNIKGLPIKRKGRPFFVFMKTLTSPTNAGSSIGEGSMKKAMIGPAVPLEKMPF
jgi:hypothetical protein